MGEYIFTIGGKEYKVDVKEMTGDLATVVIDGKEVSITIKQLGKKDVIKRRIRKKATMPVVQAAAPAPIQVAPPPSSKMLPIRAPLPGIVLKILVAEGDRITAGQDIVVMEAMKMENQIQATHGGIVAKINVKQDDVVQQDDVLMEIDPS